VHADRGFLAGLYLVFIGALLFTLGIILFNFVEFAIVQKYLGCAAFIHNRYSDFIPHRFGHGIGIDHRAEYVERCIDRRAGKTDIGGVGQRVVQVVGKAVSLFNFGFRDCDFLIQVGLAAVRLVGNTNHIAAVGQ